MGNKETDKLIRVLYPYICVDQLEKIDVDI